ncbi:hypothetical protein D3C72_1323380 [compost metagenome]
MDVGRARIDLGALQGGQLGDLVNELARGRQEFLGEDAVGRVHVAALLGLEDGVARAQIIASGLADALPQRRFLGRLYQRLDLLLQGGRIPRGRGGLFREERRQAGVGAFCNGGGAGDAGLDIAGPIADPALLDQRTLGHGFNRFIDVGQADQPNQAHDDDHGQQNAESPRQAGSKFQIIHAASSHPDRRANADSAVACGRANRRPRKPDARQPLDGSAPKYGVQR